MTEITKEMADKAYRDGNPIMSDAEYESKFGLQASDRDTPLDKSNWKKYTHTTKMASLAKVKVYENDKFNWKNMQKWLEDTEDGFICTPKYDGLAIALYYQGGHLIRAVTRGDGKVGEDITRNVEKMQNVKVFIPYLTGILKGEILMSKADYKKYLSETEDKRPYKNTRNGASGAAKALDGRNCKYLTIKYYDIEQTERDFDNKTFEFKHEFDKFSLLYELFGSQDAGLAPKLEHIKKVYKQQMDEREEFPFDVDGMVVAYNSIKVQEELGTSPNGNPKFKIALKFPHLMAETTITDVEWSVGKSGAVTPIAHIELVDLGVDVRRVSLANLDKVKKLWNGKDICVGDRVIVARANDVIPNIIKVVSRWNGEEI